MIAPYNYDGPVNTKLRSYSENKLASRYLRHFEHLGRQMHMRTSFEELLGDKISAKAHPRGHRIGTWVEDESQEFGYGFIISDPNEIAGTVDDFSIDSAFYKVRCIDSKAEDGGDIHTLGEDPMDFQLRSDAGAGQLDAVLEVYQTKENLVHVVSILGKMTTAYANDQITPDFETTVSFGMHLASH